MRVDFPCPECDYPGKLLLPGQGEWRCPRCDLVTRPAKPSPTDDFPACAICGCKELYKKKDFPHGLGMAILIGACLASTISYYLYEKWWTWAILIGSALFDGLLYLWVKDVVVCYRCNAHHRGLPIATPHPPFELTVHEKYRQERIRLNKMTGSE